MQLTESDGCDHLQPPLYGAVLIRVTLDKGVPPLRQDPRLGQTVSPGLHQGQAVGRALNELNAETALQIGQLTTGRCLRQAQVPRRRTDGAPFGNTGKSREKGQPVERFTHT